MKLLKTFGLLGVCVLMTTCSSQETTSSVFSEKSTIPATGTWGDFKPVMSVKELMKYTIDPLSDNIFNSVSSTITRDGMVDVEPRTDSDWEKIQVGAVTLAEGANLLKIRRPFAPPGDDNNSIGPDASELSPAEIMAKVERDPVEWNARIEALRNVALEVLDIVKRRDVNELWDAGENLDHACEACHRSYWYPAEDAAFYLRLRQRFKQHS